MLTDAGRLEPGAASALSDAYVFLRDLEHRLQMVADRQTHRLPEDEAGLAVVYRRRGTSRIIEERFAYMINCTGPLGTISRTRDPMLKRLLEKGLARPDQLGIALDEPVKVVPPEGDAIPSTVRTAFPASCGRNRMQAFSA